jgi:hypothetical protein
MKWEMLRGTIRNGYGRASQCLPLQIKLFAKGLPEISSMYPGTINVELENPVHFLKYDYETIEKWHEIFFPEKFSFIKASFWPDAERFKNSVPCLLCFPSTSPHRLNPFILEVITEKLDLTGVTKCSVQFNQQSRTANWVIFGDNND